MEEKKVILRSYPSIWHYKKKIYSLENVKLPVPIVVEGALFFAGAELFMLLISYIPIFSLVPAAIRYFILPFFIMKFLMTKTFDGKKPHKFLLGMIEFMLSPKAYSRFKPIEPPERDKKIKFTKVYYRPTKIIDLTKYELKKGGKKK